jgi:hypothetical protein
MAAVVASSLAFVPPWLLLATLLGVINAAACYLLLGRRLRQIAWYVAIGALAAPIGQVLGQAVQAPAPVQIGDLNVLLASAAAWAVLSAAKLAGL